MTIDVDTDKRKMNLWQKLAAIMGEVDAIPKTGRNQNQQYNFIEQAVVAAKLRTYFAQYGLAIIPGMEECHQELRTTKSGGTSTHTLARATYTLVNADNPAETVTVPWYGESDDSGDKGVNKAGTSAEKYFLMKLLLLSDKDDPDAETPEPLAPKQPTHSQAARTVQPARTPVAPNPTVEPERNYAPIDESRPTDRQLAYFADSRKILKMDMGEFNAIVEKETGQPDIESCTMVEAKRVYVELKKLRDGTTPENIRF